MSIASEIEIKVAIVPACPVYPQKREVTASISDREAKEIARMSELQ
jgi:hypothetical protein